MLEIFSRKFACVALLLTLFPNSASGELLSFGSSSTYGGKKVELTGEFETPKGNKQAPLVVLMHGCSGLEGAVTRSLKAHARALNQSGFATLLLDSFAPRGISGGWVCKRNSRLASAQAYRQRDVSDAVKFLSASNRIDPKNVFVMGQSNGGTTAVLIARSRRIPGLRAAVAYYPWCVIVGNGSKTPLLILAGTEDDWTPPDNCIANHNPAKGLTVVTYPGAFHSFDLPISAQEFQGHRVGGDSKATADSRKRMIRFFRKHLN